MSDEIRKQIRDALKAALTGLATTGSRVYASEVYPSGDARLPGLNILTGDTEVAEDGVYTGRILIWDMRATIECRAKPADGTELADQLDAMAGEVIEALMADRTLGGLAIGLIPSRTNAALTPALERPAGVVFVTVTITFME